MKVVQRILSVVLAVIISVGCCIPAFATESVSGEESRYPLGDADLSGKVTAADARLILRVSAKLTSIDSYRLTLADYNQDGSVTAADARFVLRLSAKLDPFAPEPTTQPVTTTKAPEPTTKKPEKPTVLTDANRKYKVETSPLFSTSYAKYAVLYDYDNDKILYGKNMHAKCHPASTTKIITAVLGCEYLSGDYVLTVGKELYLVETNTSRAELRIGQKIKFKEILKCLLAPSGCDAAYTIAVHVAREASGNKNMSASKALSYFVNLMNTYTKKLGMNDSHFANPDGFPNSNHYVSAYDMAIITTKAYSFKLIRNVVSEPWVTAYFETGERYSFTNTNETINPYSDKYYPYMVGMKTGSHSLAGKCLITVAKKNIERTGKTKTFVAVVFGCETKYGRYTDLKNLYNTAFSYFWRQP